jgi:hypothetical protein
MKWTLEILTAVDGDIDAASAWYDQQRPGFSAELAAEVQRLWTRSNDNR